MIAGELEGTGKKAVWIDTGNESSTYALGSKNPGLMDKVKIGRAFTPFQHHNLIQKLEKFIEPETELLILSNITHLYINGQIKKWEAEELFKETWNKIKKIQEDHDLKILVSLPKQESGLNGKVKKDSQNIIEVEKTSEGVKYSSEDFKQVKYSKNGGAQTTFSLWEDKTIEKRKVKAKAG